MKAPSLPVSEKNNFELYLLSSYVPTCDPPPPPGGANLPQGLHTNKLERGPQVNAISKLCAFQFQRRSILKMGFFVSMFQFVIPGAGPGFTPGASYEQTWYRFHQEM